MKVDACVADYIQHFRESAQSEMAYFAGQENLSAAITVAAACIRADGKKHSHQRRIPLAVLSEAAQRLHVNKDIFSTAQSFSQLHATVDAMVGPIHGIGELAVYDISHRIGVFLGLQPENVYLHAGSRIGAAALGIRGKVVEKSRFPDAFAPLTASEIEDCLCIYKGPLSGKDAAPTNCGERSSPLGCRPVKTKKVPSC